MQYLLPLLNRSLNSNFDNLEQASTSLNLTTDDLKVSVEDLAKQQPTTKIKFDQFIAVEQIIEIIKDESSKISLVIAPTGSGKTLGFIKAAKKLGISMLFVVPTNALKETLIRDERYNLTEVKIKELLDEELGILHATCNYDTAAYALQEDINVLGRFDLVIIDEAHFLLDQLNFRTEVTSTLLRWFLKAPTTRTIALTATLSALARPVFGNTTPVFELQREKNPTVSINFIGMDQTAAEEKKIKVSYTDAVVNTYKTIILDAEEESASVLIIDYQSLKKQENVATTLGIQLVNSTVYGALKNTRKQAENTDSEAETTLLNNEIDRLSYIDDLFEGKRDAKVTMGSSFMDSGTNLITAEETKTAYIILNTSLQRAIKPHSLVQGINRFRGVETIKVFVLYSVKMYSPAISFVGIGKSKLKWLQEMNTKMFGLNSIRTNIALLKYLSVTENLVYNPEYIRILQDETMLGNFEFEYNVLSTLAIIEQFGLKAKNPEYTKLFKLAKQNLTRLYELYESVVKEKEYFDPTKLSNLVSREFGILPSQAAVIVSQVMKYNFMVFTALEVRIENEIFNATNYEDYMATVYANKLVKDEDFMTQLTARLHKLPLTDKEQLVDLYTAVDSIQANDDSTFEKKVVKSLIPTLESVRLSLKGLTTETGSFSYKERRAILNKILAIKTVEVVKQDGKTTNELRLFGFAPASPVAFLGKSLYPRPLKNKSTISTMAYLPVKTIEEEVIKPSTTFTVVSAPADYKIGMSIASLHSHTTNAEDKVLATKRLTYYRAYATFTIDELISGITVDPDEVLLAVNGFQYKDNRRLKANLIDVKSTVLILDIDNPESELMGALHTRLKNDNITHIITTTSNPDNLHKYRIILPVAGISALNWREASLVFATKYDLKIDKLAATQMMFIYAKKQVLAHNGNTILEFTGLHNYEFNASNVRVPQTDGAAQQVAISNTPVIEQVVTTTPVSEMPTVTTPISEAPAVATPVLVNAEVKQLTPAQLNMYRNFKAKNISDYFKELSNAVKGTRHATILSVYGRMTYRHYTKEDFEQLMINVLAVWNLDLHADSEAHIRVLINNYPSF